MSTATHTHETTIGTDAALPMVHLAEDAYTTHAICGAPLVSPPGEVLPDDEPLDCVVCAELERSSA